MYSELTNVVTTNAAEAAARSYCNEWIGLDIAIKAIGMLLSMTIFSQAMMWVVLFYRCYHRRLKVDLKNTLQTCFFVLSLN